MNRKAWIVVLSILALVATALLILRAVQSGYAVLRAYTDDAGGLSEGTSVRLNGIPIGYLDKLNLTDSRDPKRRIEFVMKVRRRDLGDIPRDSLVDVAATNLLGNYFLDIIRGHSTETVAENGELQTSTSIDPNRMMAQMGNEFQEISAIFDRFGKLLADVPQGHGNIGRWQTEGLQRLNRVADEYAQLQTSIRNAHGNLSKVDELNAQTQAAQKRLDDLLAGLQNGQGTAGNLKNLSSDLDGLNKETSQLTAAFNSDQGPAARLQKIQNGFDEFSQHVQNAADRMNAGQGTLGQLTVNPQLSTALAKTSAEFQALAQGVRQNPKKFLTFHISLF
jgi:phospholipid/cholesterol/gamma-HCH transport system substrate-binding protein